MHNTERLLMVNPMRIELFTYRDRLDENKSADVSTMQGGSWDHDVGNFKNFDVWQAFEQRFTKGVAWQQTEFYDRIIEEIASGTPKWGCQTQSQFDTRCEGLDKLYAEIQRNGFRQQSELESEKVHHSNDEISVSIDRHGRLLFEDGRHRLSIAKLLKLKAVPVQVSVRHTTWLSFCQKVEEYTTRFSDRAYEPIPHPDLNYHPSTYGDERFEIIREAVGASSGKMLDIGAHWGYFCHRFEMLGMDCTAIENASDQLYFLMKLHTAAEARFEIHSSSILDLAPSQYDVTLALNTFPSYLKTSDTFAQLEHFLARLQTRFLIFQPHLYDCPQMQGAYRNFRPQEFVDWILKCSGLNQAKQLGKTKDDRPIYLLTSN